MAQKEITIEWENDTTWYVNPDFDVSLASSYAVEVVFPMAHISGYSHFRIDWGDGDISTETYALNQENTIRHTYIDPGLYEMKINIFDNPACSGTPLVYHKIMMNRNLSANFRLEPENSRRCMEWGGDSIMMIMDENENPPGTSYKIQISSDVEKAGVLVESAFETSWIDSNHDSAWIVAKVPTGIYGAKVGLQVTYKKDVHLVVPPTEWKSFFVYKTPDLRDIYHFTDTLVNGGPFPFLDACSGDVVRQMWLDTTKLLQYQYRTAFNPAVTPYYHSINDKQAFQIDYFWTGSVPDENTEWQNVTADPEFVDTTELVFLKKGGYYKIRVAAYNQCGYDLGGDQLLRMDSLWTDSLRDEPEKRYFRVYEQAADKIVCLQDSVCGYEVVIADRNVRQNYDPYPEYKLEISGPDGTEVKKFYKISDTYLDGRVINGEEGWSAKGCDSTLLKITFEELGIYHIKLTRKTIACEPIEKQFIVSLGLKPESSAALIENKLIQDYSFVYDNEKGIYQKCDSFRYVLQQDLWTQNTYDLDSVWFYFAKGNVKRDTVFGDEHEFYDFDSTGNLPNQIVVRAHNYCGWKEIGTAFYTRTKPEVTLLRDGMPENDSLCLGFTYDYQMAGLFPEHAMVKYQANRSVYVDNALQHEYEIKEINNYQGEKFNVRHWQAGATKEGIIVINNDMFTCTQIYNDTLYAIVPPDTLVFKDTIRYCGAGNEIQTEKLFLSGKHTFRQAEWVWNEELPLGELLPVFHYTTGETDSLHYRLSNSKGCYISGKLVFEPQTVPKLKLEDQYTICMPDTLKDYETAGFVTEVEKNGRSVLSVYEGQQAAGNLLCQSGRNCFPLILSGLPYEKIRLIYVLENTAVTTEFMEGCRLEDTVDIRLYSPELKIMKEDTLHYDWLNYSFRSMEEYIDTVEIAGHTLHWGVAEGTGSLIPDAADRLYGGSYTTSANDRTSDELRFVLYGETRCGKELNDTLVVRVAHGGLEGYTDTICSIGDYVLWEKVNNTFVDESSLMWEICYPDDPALQGHLSANTGSGVKYTPYAGLRSPDSVKIYVEGSFAEAAGYQVGDTIILKVNPAPQLTVGSDTLIADLHEVNVSRISEEWFQTEHALSCKITAVTNSNNGSLVNDTVYRFNNRMPADGDNRYADVHMTVSGLPGCAVVNQSFTLLDLTAVDFNFKHLSGLCAGDEVALDSLYTRPKNFDRFTFRKWNLEGDAPQGTLDRDSSHYIAPLSSGERTLKLEVSKSYKAYNGQVYSGMSPVSRELKMMIHPEAILTLSHQQDTICRAENEIEIYRNWVQVTPDIYKDSVRLNGMVFRNDLNYLSMVGPGKEDTLIFSVSQPGCMKWEKSKDTLFLYRLPSMITGDFQVSSVCESGNMPVHVTGDLLHPLAVDYNWIGTGGEVSGSSPVYTPEGYGNGTGAVTLHVQPPHGCDEDTLRKEFSISHLPEVIFEADTVCRIAGQMVEIPVGETVYDGVDKIQWYRKGSLDLLGVTNGNAALKFSLSGQDVSAGFVDVVAHIFPSAPCLSVDIYDTIHIALWTPPQINLPVASPVVCQGSELDLSAAVGVIHASEAVWTLQSPDAGQLEGPLYMPGEYWGNVDFKVKATGQYGCPDEEEQFTVEVLYAPLPTAKVKTDLLCQQDSVYFDVQEVVGVHADYSWDFGDTDGYAAGKDVAYVYREAGEFRVALTADYNGCQRTTGMDITLYPKPEAIFELPGQVAIGKEIELTSLSQPADVICKWTFENDPADYYGKMVSHTFGGEIGERKVLLEVSTPYGCKDTVSYRTWAVVLPAAEFSVHVDSCSGLVHFSNTSVRNKADVSWDFGNGTTNTGEWNPADITYERTYSDTVYYVTLTLSNAAGSVTETRPVKLVSKLKAGAEVLPVTDGCNKSEKEIHVLTSGVADTTRIWWGDGSEEYWTREQEVILRRHRYNNDGTTVKYYPLVVEVKNKCEQDILSPVSVPVYPESVKARVVLDEQYENECLGEVRGFMNKSFGFTPSGYVCEWQFEKGGELLTDQREKVEHLFSRPGTYWVKLSVRDNCNADIDSVMVNVHGNDSLMFTYDQHVLCTGNEIRLNFVQYGEAAFSNFHWTLPDGTRQSGREITYRPQAAGKCLVSLAAVADGCPAVVRDSLEVYETPVAVIGPVETRGCQPFRLMLKGQNDSQVKALPLWDFQDHTSASAFELSKTFEEEGEYDVVFKLTTAEGCADSVFLPVTVLHSPEAGMVLREKLFCTTDGNFEAMAVNTRPEGASRYSFGWWKGNELVSVNPDSAKFSFDHTFGKAGLKLVVTDKNTGCQVEKADTVVSSRSVKAIMQVEPAQEVCEGETVVFENISQNSKHIRWDFGDGETAFTTVYEHVFSSAGTYEVCLHVMNDAGCADSVRIPYRVGSVPVVAFSWENDRSLTGLPDTLKLPDKPTGGIHFVNESYLPGEDTELLAFKWSFGDQSADSDEHSPAHIYETNGNYEVWLYASTPLGCADSVSDWVYISALKGLFLPNAFVPASADEGVSRFQPKGVGLTSYQIAVYDHWGTCVWSSDKLEDSRPAEYWDGTFKNQPLPKGLYLWKVNAIFLDGTVWDNVGGYVNLIR